ncbi:MAG: hypothetical protein AAB873_01745 [Patescibacteria group bacterium]
MNKYAKTGSVLQSENEKIGNIFFILGIILVVVVPRILNVRYQNDVRSNLIYFFVTNFGLIIFFIGLKLRIYAYKTPEETPKWLTTLVKMFEW